ncbi:MAG TPA: ribonuclease Z [Ktedonobacteraceae bacterium]|jgi:ribonuclease BN (tRNA processing enzyme)|nr:ribonuclease Z [Ktedonobacteraceae bacterium]
MSRLTLLGTGTCQIEHERRASSVLVELDGFLILFDCGHGVLQRLLEAGIQHNMLDHIVVSHFHPDHVSDLIPFLQAGAWSQRDPRTSDVHIYGPAGLQHFINGLLTLFTPSSFMQPGYNIHVHEIPTPLFSIGPYFFDFVSLPPAGNHGLRFTWNGRHYAITGDSHFHEREVDFLSGVDLAIIDAGHLQDEEIVQLAARSQAKQIICSHLYRELDEHTLQEQAKDAGYTGTILVGCDLMTFVL